MKVIDSSGWIEFYKGTELGSVYHEHIAEIASLITPTVVLYEVYKVVKRDHSEAAALCTIGHMAQTQVVELDQSLALEAADYALSHGLAMADAWVYATARRHDALLITSDADFDGLDGVQLLAKLPTPTGGL